MSAVNLSAVKNDLKTIGCKLKSQLDGTWAICEPKGVRVIVPTLEDVNIYYLAKTGQNKVDNDSKPVAAAPVASSVASSVETLKARVEESRSRPNPFLDNPATLPETPPDSVKVPEIHHEALVEKAVNKVNTVSPDKESKLPKTSLTDEEDELRLSDLRIALKALGCQLKSQLDGSWAICEPKGARVIVPTLAAVKEYCVAKTLPNVAREKTAMPEKITKPLTAAALANLLPAETVQKEPVAGSSHHGTTGAQISDQQKIAIAAVNSFINEMKQKRLASGLNLLHSEIKPHLLQHGCPEALMDKAYSYAEAKLYKDCLDKVLIKRTFANHALQKNDVMYFDSKYADLFGKQPDHSSLTK